MPSINSLVPRLVTDFPDLHFVASDSFYWSPKENTVYYTTGSDNTASLLHELAHGVLDHQDYTKDIQLVEIERDAWSYATNQLGPLYGMVISNDISQDALDSYRDWLHARSSCPICTATGCQTKKQHYRCLACGHDWRVNEARLCGLKRYSVKTKK